MSSSESASLKSATTKVDIHPIRGEEVEEAEKLVRLAFGTFFNAPNPTENPSERRMIVHRFDQNPHNVIAATLDGVIVGTNVLTEWGSFGFFGPLAVRPDLWNSGIGGKLVAAAVDKFESDGISSLGLFTFADSPKHLGLYHKFGFCSRFLTPLMEKKIESNMTRTYFKNYRRFSKIAQNDRSQALDEIRALTEPLYPGLDLSREIQLVDDFKMGETLLVFDESRNLAAFAICQTGAGTEAGLDRCYIKFGASRIGPKASNDFTSLLKACESYAAESKVSILEAGMNLSHDAAFDVMLRNKFQISFIGVNMQKPNEPAYNRRETFVIDDLR